MAGQIAGHNAESQAVEGRNRAKLYGWQQNEKIRYTEAIMDNAEYLNDISEADGEGDRTYQAMMDQWTQEDFTLKKLFAEGDQEVEKAIIEMYENDYAGSQTGKTAMRLAGKSAMKAGQRKSEIMNKLMFAKEETTLKKEAIGKKGSDDMWRLHEKIMFAPTHKGPTPPPIYEQGPSSAGLLVGLAGSAIGGIQSAGANTAPDIWSGGGMDWNSTPSLGLSNPYLS